MKCTPLLFASLAGLAVAGPVINCQSTSTNTTQRDEAQKLREAVQACFDKADDVFVHCRDALGKPVDQCIQEGDKEEEKCRALDSPAQPKEHVSTVDQQLQEHCGRPGNDKDACIVAARRCTAQVKPDATAQEFLECVDILQVCADQGAVFKLDQCIDNARACNAQEKAPLGDLAKLGQCAKKDL